MLKAISLVLLVALAGCVSLDAEQVLKRDANSDLEIRITIPDDTISTAWIKDHIKINEQFRHTISETDSTVSYLISDIKTGSGERLFILDAEAQSTLQPWADAISAPLDYELSRKPGLLYDTYSYRLRFGQRIYSGDSPSQIMDDASVLDQESLDMLKRYISEIEREHQTDIMVITRPDLQPKDIIQLISPYAGPPRGSGGVIVLVSSTLDMGFCTMYTNIMDENLVDINEAGIRYEEACSSDQKGAIIAAVSEIKASLNPPGSQASQTEAGPKVTMTVQSFGKVMETNGVVTAPGRVRFDIDAESSGEYTMVFRETALFGAINWKHAWLIGGGFALMLFLIALFIISRRPRPKRQIANPKITEYISKARASGLDDEMIRERLTRTGWDQSEIEICLSQR